MLRQVKEKTNTATMQWKSHHTLLTLLYTGCLVDNKQIANSFIALIWLLTLHRIKRNFEISRWFWKLVQDLYCMVLWLDIFSGASHMIMGWGRGWDSVSEMIFVGSDCRLSGKKLSLHSFWFTRVNHPSQAVGYIHWCPVCPVREELTESPWIPSCDFWWSQHISIQYIVLRLCRLWLFHSSECDNGVNWDFCRRKISANPSEP